MFQPEFHIFQISNNTNIIRNTSENNSTGFAGAIILLFLMYYFCIFWRSEKSENLAGAFFAYFVFSTPRPPCLGRAHYKSLDPPAAVEVFGAWGEGLCAVFGTREGEDFVRLRGLQRG
jgi:hypothetical protein